jgi:antitoxin (DNA-binding transcriptional repressor) of toxin-antitoxin stability system
MQYETIPISEFKAKCLNLCEEIHEGKKLVTISKHGKPFVEVSPIAEKTQKLFGMLKGSVKISGDIISPINEKWDAEK